MKIVSYELGGVNAEKTSSKRRFGHTFALSNSSSFSKHAKGIVRRCVLITLEPLEAGKSVRRSRPAHDHPVTVSTGSFGRFFLYHTLSVSFVNPKDL